jgi:hypothetical protein
MRHISRQMQMKIGSQQLTFRIAYPEKKAGIIFSYESAYVLTSILLRSVKFTREKISIGLILGLQMPMCGKILASERSSSPIFLRAVSN